MNLKSENLNELIPLEPHGASSTPATLIWQNLEVVSKSDGRQLLTPMNGEISGGFWAVMGPSGSGKSTLLNALACRLDHGVERRGILRLNGKTYTNRQLKAMSCYVMQEDVLNAYLTVEDTLLFTARLRLPPKTSIEQIKERVEHIIQQMELKKARNTIVGNSLLKGISGGEKKRLCIGMELLMKPALIFLDEPTSGLDSITALIICKRLKHLADSGRYTIVSTIHQPQSKIFHLFDNLLLLKDGVIYYQGNLQKGIKFFEDRGFPLPESTNPADHVLDIIMPVNEEFLSQKYEPNNIGEMNNIEVNVLKGSERLFPERKDQILWRQQFMILCERNLKEYRMNYKTVLTKIFIWVFMASFIGTVFFQVGNDANSVSKRASSLFFCCINQGIFVAIETLNTFPAERALTLRERKAGTYQVSAYFLARFLIDFLVRLVNPIIFSFIAYFLIGYQGDASKFVTFMAFMMLCSQASTSLTVMVTTLCRTIGSSVIFLPLILELTRLFGGFFLVPALLPNYFVWLDALSYTKYAFTGVINNEFQGLTLYCTEKQLNSGMCTYLQGEQYIELNGFDYLNKGQCALVLLGYIMFTRAIAYLGIRYLK